jgi:peptide/nickel transport system substrate-binding protein
LALLILALVLGGGLAGGAFLLAGGDSNPKPELAASPSPEATGGLYVEGAIGFPTTLNPLLARTQSERDLTAILFRGLTWVDGSGRTVPDLASDWTVSDDGLRYVFHLRPDAVWHDGEPVTAADVLFTIRLVQDPDFSGDAAIARFWRAVIVEAPSDRDVSFRLIEPFAAFAAYARLPILPKHVLGGVVARDLGNVPFNLSPVGSGAYQVEQIDRENQTISLEATARTDGEKPSLSSVRFRYFSDAESLLAALRSRTIDGTGAIAASALLRPGALPQGETVFAPLTASYTAMFFNLRNSLFADVQTRRALSMAVDRQGIVDGALPMQADPAEGPIPSTSWAFSPRSPTFDVEDAARTLEKAGWRDADGDGVLEAGSSRLSFPLLVNADDPQRMAVASQIAEQLRKIKVEVQVQAASSGEVARALETRQFVAAIFGWHSNTGDPDCFEFWHSAQADEGMNVTGLRDPEVDSLLDDARQTTDLAKRRDLYTRFQERFSSDVPALILYYPRYAFVVDSRIEGASADPLIDPDDRFKSLPSWHLRPSSK